MEKENVQANDTTAADINNVVPGYKKYYETSGTAVFHTFLCVACNKVKLARGEVKNILICFCI